MCMWQVCGNALALFCCYALDIATICQYRANQHVEKSVPNKKASDTPATDLGSLGMRCLSSKSTYERYLQIDSTPSR